MNPKPILSPDESRTVTTFLRGVEMLRSIDPKLGLGEMLTLLHLAANPTASLVEIGKDLGVTSGAVSGHIRTLGPGHRGEGPGLDLLSWKINPMNCRQKLFELTPRGEMLLTQFLHVFDKTLKGPAGRQQAGTKRGERSESKAPSAEGA